MKLEDQVITKEQAIHLTNLGITAPAYFCYFQAPSHAGICWSEIPIRHIAILSGAFYDIEDVDLYLAYNVAELGHMLPIDPSWGRYSYYHRYNCKGHSVGYSEIAGSNHIEIGWLKTEAEARSALLIKLIEEGLISVEEINKLI